MQERLKTEMDLLVDIPKSGGIGNTSYGNTAPSAFDQLEQFSCITGVCVELLVRFSVILTPLHCKFLVDSMALFLYCEETIDHFNAKYNWYYLPCSVHKVPWPPSPDHLRHPHSEMKRRKIGKKYLRCFTPFVRFQKAWTTFVSCFRGQERFSGAIIGI